MAATGIKLLCTTIRTLDLLNRGVLVRLATAALQFQLVQFIFIYCKVASSRPVYYPILNSFGQRSQYISIKFTLYRQSLNVLLTKTVYCSQLYVKWCLIYLFPSTTGTIYTILNTFGYKQDFLTQVFGPFGSLFITLRWVKNLIMATSTFILLNFVFAPQETLDVLREQG